MGWLEKLFGVQVKATQPTAAVALPVGMAGRQAFGSVVNYGQYLQLYEQNPILQGCAMAYQLTMPEAPLWAYDNNGKVIEQHGVYAILEASQWERVFSRAMLYLCISGNAYIYKVRANGVVKYLKVYSDEFITPIVDKYGVVTKYRYTVDAKEIPIDKEDIIHLTAFWHDPRRDWMGDSPIRLSYTSVASFNEAATTVYSLHKNDAVPNTVIVYDEELTPTQQTTIRESFGKRYGGANKGMAAHLWGVRSVQRLALNYSEMGMTDTFAQLESRICGTYRVHPIMAYTYAGLQMTTYSNFEQAAKDFTQYTRVPLYAILSSQLTEGFRSEYPDINLRFNVDSLQVLKPTQAEALTRAREAYLAGIMTIAEVREVYDLAAAVVPEPVATSTKISNKAYDYKDGDNDITDEERPLYEALRKGIEELGKDITKTYKLGVPVTERKSIDWDDWTDKLLYATEEERKTIILNAIATAINEIGTDAEGEYTEAVRSGVKESASKIRKSIGAIREEVQKVLVANPYASVEDIYNELTTFFKTLAPARAAMIARTTVTATEATAKAEVQKDYNSRKPPEKQVVRMWVALPKARKAHREANGQYENEAGLFVVGGEVTDKPAGDGLSAWNAVNCRCRTRLVKKSKVKQ